MVFICIFPMAKDMESLITCYWPVVYPLGKLFGSFDYFLLFLINSILYL